MGEDLDDIADQNNPYPDGPRDKRGPKRGSRKLALKAVPKWKSQLRAHKAYSKRKTSEQK